VLGLCLIVAAYNAVDVAGPRPADPEVRQVALLVSER
jgi:hypothetical protein